MRSGSGTLVLPGNSYTSAVANRSASPSLPLQLALPDLELETIGLNHSLATIFSNLQLSNKAECTNFEYEGFNVRDIEGAEIEIIAWRKPSVKDELNHPQGISFNRIGADGGVEFVDQFTVVEKNGRFARNRAKLEFEKILEELQASENVGSAQKRLQTMVRAGVVRYDGFAPKCEEFNPHRALLSDKPQLAKALDIWLQDRGVDTSSWGQSPSRDVTTLAQQIMNREAFVSFECGKVYISCEVVLMDIRNPEGNRRLYESHQVKPPSLESPDGSVRVRRSLGSVLAEKAQPFENYEDVAMRLMEEELQIPDAALQYRHKLKQVGSLKELGDSVCFPGCTTRNLYVGFEVTLDAKDHRVEYVEESEVTTVSRWSQPLAA